VTGGAGFIGSHVVDALLGRGDEVTVVDDLSTGRRENLEQGLAAGATLEEGDIRDAAWLADVTERVQAEAMFHLAAQIDVRKSVADPAFDARINVEGTINVLEAARRADVGRVVFSSTGGAIYGEADNLPAAEDTEGRPLAPYGTAKYAAEVYSGLFERLHGLSVAAVRYGNVYGPRQDPLGEAGVIAIFCGKLEAGETATIFGDGTQTRDYIYVSDVVDATLAAGGSDAGGAFNVGTGVETSVLDIVEALRAESGANLEVEHAPERPGEVQRSVLDTARAQRELGWRAQVDLREGMRRTLRSM